MTQIETATLSQGVRRMLGLSLDSWNGVMVASLAIAALAALIVGFSTFAIIRLQKAEAKDARDAFEKYKLGVVEKTAELESDAANAGLETEKIKEVVAWRVVSPENALELEKALAAKPGSVNLRWMDSDPEALFFAIQISHVLAKAHWKIASGAVKPPNTIVFGIALPDEDGDDAETLRRAFSSAKIQFSTRQVPEGLGFSISTIAGAPTLMIGSRTPPELP
jgi:hypothetical protein